MNRPIVSEQQLEAYRDLVARVIGGAAPPDHEMDPCRAAVQASVATGDGETAMQALCMLLEGALADPGLGIDDTQVVVPLLRALARGQVTPAEVAPARDSDFGE